MQNKLFTLQKALIFLFLITNGTFAQSFFMLGAKTFTIDFKGYSGFMAELGGGSGIAVNGNDNIFLGVSSGFGYAGDSKRETDIRYEYSSVILPIKAFGSYGMVGASIGTMLNFWDAKVNYLNTLKKDKGVKGSFDFGLMIFPVENISIGFDVLLSDGATGFVLGADFYFGKNNSNQYSSYDDYDDYQNEEYNDCAVISSDIQEIYFETENEISICIVLKNEKENCLKLGDKFAFKNKSIAEVRDYETKNSYLKFNAVDADISYSEFFPNGICD